jgi:hypothetical protein
MSITEDARSGWPSTVTSFEIMEEDRSACPGQPKTHYWSNCIWNECKWCMNGWRSTENILIWWNSNNRGCLEQLQLFIYIPWSHHDKATECSSTNLVHCGFFHFVYLFIFVFIADRLSSKTAEVQTYPVRPAWWHFCKIIFICYYISILYVEDKNECKVKLALCLIN